jgi:hypothetical protein
MRVFGYANDSGDLGEQQRLSGLRREVLEILDRRRGQSVGIGQQPGPDAAV